jgi:hypothetical protein
MLVVGDCSLDTFKRDIVVETRNKELKRISELHPAYMALQYPLLWCILQQCNQEEQKWKNNNKHINARLLLLSVPLQARPAQSILGIWVVM